MVAVAAGSGGEVLARKQRSRWVPQPRALRLMADVNSRNRNSDGQTPLDLAMSSSLWPALRRPSVSQTPLPGRRERCRRVPHPRALWLQPRPALRSPPRNPKVLPRRRERGRRVPHPSFLGLPIRPSPGAPTLHQSCVAPRPARRSPAGGTDKRALIPQRDSLRPGTRRPRPRQGPQHARPARRSRPSWRLLLARLARWGAARRQLLAKRR